MFAENRVKSSALLSTLLSFIVVLYDVKGSSLRYGKLFDRFGLKDNLDAQHLLTGLSILDTILLSNSFPLLTCC